MPDSPTVSEQIAELTTLAVGLFERGDLDQADGMLSVIAGLAPDNFIAAKYLGVIKAARGLHGEAIEQLNAAIALNDNDAVAFNVLSVCHFSLGDHQPALAFAERAIRLAPAYPEAHNSRGNALNGLERHDEALAAFQRSLALKPGDPLATINLANALRGLDRSAEALEVVDRVIARDGAIADAHYNRANILQDLGRHDDAIRSYDAALALAPSTAVYHLNRAYCHLLTGHLMEGWRGQEWRWRKPGAATPPRSLPMPLWLGQADLGGKSILLHCEQGLGDCIQFVRYAPALAARGASVVIEAYHPLADLFATVEGVKAVVARGTAPPITDFHCPLMSLPLALAQARVSPSEPYLFPPPDIVAAWRAKLPGAGPLKIGVANRGNANHKNDANRSIPLEFLARFLPPGPDYVVIQKDLPPEDRQVLETRHDIRFVGDAVESFMDSAAICAAMDLVISVDTSIAHLAGALGRPTWILLPFDPDWRWGLAREASDWYPSAKLYRQPARRDWPGALARVAADLAALVAAPGEAGATRA